MVLEGLNKTLNKPLRSFGSNREELEPAAIQQHWGCAVIRNQDAEINHCFTHSYTHPNRNGAHANNAVNPSRHSLFLCL